MKEKPQDEYVDPQAPPRLSRRNIVAVVLAVAGVLLALFFGSRRVAAPDDPTYDAPLDLELLGDRPPMPVPWEKPVERTDWPRSTPDRADPRRLRYDEALRSRSVLHVEAAPNNTADAPPSGHVLAEASVIEAAMMTGVDSSRPGPIIAQVVRPVYDTATLDHVLVPGRHTPDRFARRSVGRSGSTDHHSVDAHDFPGWQFKRPPWVSCD